MSISGTDRSDMANMWDVFFSYRRHDLDRARPLLEELARAGISVWRDEADTGAGLYYVDNP
ncbi:MAG TPA: hypothetical protein VGK64_16415 [Bryobacteraceae bacterium]